MSLVSDNVRHSFQLQEAQYAFLRFFLTTNLCLAAEFIFKSLKTRKLGLRGMFLNIASNCSAHGAN